MWPTRCSVTHGCSRLLSADGQHMTGWFSYDLWPSRWLVPVLGRARMQRRRPCDGMRGARGASSISRDWCADDWASGVLLSTALASQLRPDRVLQLCHGGTTPWSGADDDEPLASAWMEQCTTARPVVSWFVVVATCRRRDRAWVRAGRIHCSSTGQSRQHYVSAQHMQSHSSVWRHTDDNQSTLAYLLKFWAASSQW